jgi:hypothetical protein
VIVRKTLISCSDKTSNPQAVSRRIGLISLLLQKQLTGLSLSSRCGQHLEHITAARLGFADALRTTEARLEILPIVNAMCRNREGQPSRFPREQFWAGFLTPAGEV